VLVDILTESHHLGFGSSSTIIWCCPEKYSNDLGSQAGKILSKKFVAEIMMTSVMLGC